MEIVFKHIWIAFIAVTFVNGFALKHRAKKYIAEKPELKSGYEQYVKAWIFYGNIPWGIMAIGNLSGLTNSAFEYLTPGTMNPVVLVFHASIIALWILSIRWIYFKNGAEFIARHPGIFRKTSFSGNTNATAKQIKFLFPLLLLGGVAGMIMMWMMDIPQP